MAAEALMTISQDEAERARLRSEEKNLLDIQSEMVYERREGKREGRLEGMKEGKREGRQESHMEVLSLIAKGYTAEDIKRELEGQS